MNQQTDHLMLQIHDLSLQIEEARETLRAIRGGEIDALVVKLEDQERIFTLKSADHVYRSLVENMSEGALVIDAGGIILYCNKCFAGMVHTSLEKTIGARISDFIQLTDAEAFTRLIENGRQGNSKGEISLAAKNGGQRRILVSVSPIPLEDIRDACVVLMTDVTALRQAQEALERARDELEAKVEERTRELLRANEILAEADRRKDEFLAMLAHELRNPLAPIRTATHVLRIVGAEASELQIPLAMIERQSQHLARLVDDLLDISRLTRGKITLRKEPIDLVSIIKQVVENCRSVADQHQHEVEVNLPPHSLIVEGDDVRLTQVFSNLLSNAIKYTPNGGAISITAAEADGEACIAVKDNGIGLSGDTLPHIFELFVQANQGLDRANGGLGIGLSLVKRLAEMHGGSVEGRSEGPGQGSEFVLRLPLLR